MAVPRWARRGLLVLVSPIAEKNPLKLAALDAPIILSMARLVILLQLGVWALIGYKEPSVTAGWPYWTFGGLLSIALPLVEVLKRAPDAAVLDFAKTVFSRLGVGETQASTHTVAERTEHTIHETVTRHEHDYAEGYTPSHE